MHGVTFDSGIVASQHHYKRCGRGSARLRLGGEDREAVHDLDQSLTLEPAQPLAFLQKGQALLNMQVREEYELFRSACITLVCSCGYGSAGFSADQEEAVV